MQETKSIQAPTPWLTTQQAAEYLSTTRATLADWRTKRVGPVYAKIGGIVRYKQADLDAWLEASRVKGA